jgi:imidazolonepropionase-like amidohydrolase
MTQTVFTNVNLLDGLAPARPGTTVVVEDERILAVSSTAALEPLLAYPDAVLIDLAGKTMMPELVPCHVHLDYDSLASVHGILYNGSERPPGVTMANAIKNAHTVLQGGVTSAVGAGSSYNIDAQLKMAIQEGVADGPRMLPCSST